MTSSVQPQLMKSDRFVYDWKCYASPPKMRGAVVLVRFKNSSIVRRIVAIGGDTSQGQERSILINGSVLDESYVQHNSRLGSDPRWTRLMSSSCLPGCIS